MATLSDIKLPTRDEEELSINTIDKLKTYLYEGWGSKFSLQDKTLTHTGTKTIYADDGYLGLNSVTATIPNVQPKEGTLVKKIKISELVAGTTILPDTGYDAMAGIVIEE